MKDMAHGAAMVKNRSEKNRSETKRISSLLIVIYNTLLTMGGVLLAPLLLPLVWTATKRRQTFRQRLGLCRYPWQSDGQDAMAKRIWVHALSVGEVMSVFPLVRQLCLDYPDAKLFFTASTLTGFQTARRNFADQPVHLGYFPYDWFWAVRKVSTKIKPTHVIITESDIWPTFLWEMQRKRVPVYLINLRVSDRTWHQYRRFKWLAKSLYTAFERVCVQTPKELERLVELGVPEDRIGITGNLKFDGMSLPATTKSAHAILDDLDIPAGRRIIVAGSTHDGEEAILCEALGPILSKDSQVILMIVPRDPGRGPAIHSLCRQYGLDVRLLTRPAVQGSPSPQVVVVDAIGLLKDLYRLAYVALVGGSFSPFGGHNPIEPAFWGKPILFGKDMRDFALIADYLLRGGGALQVNDAAHLQSTVMDLLEDPDRVQRMGERSLQVVNAHRGAVHRTLSHLALAV
jgi:3-deoxy-D-manno-octulosonic-acid transferase